MKIKIYQVNHDRDQNNMAFMNTDFLQRHGDIDCASYDEVFYGEVDAKTLEDVYRIFNTAHPEGYRGRSLSVSDVVEVRDGSVKTGFYFCDSIGFAEIDFDAAKAKPLEIEVTMKTEHLTVFGHYGTWYAIDTANVDGRDYYLMEHEEYGDEAEHLIVDKHGELILEDVYNGFDEETVDEIRSRAEPEQLEPKTITVVLVEPGKQARKAEIDASLHGLQKTVGGDIESMYPFEEQVCIVCNCEGKINGLPLNRAIREEDTETDMSYQELKRFLSDAESSGRHECGYIVFSQDSFTEPYPLEARTYAVSSQNKVFQENMGGYSIYGSSLDGSDICVRLEGYMADEHGGKNGWKIERCYIKEEGKDILDIIAGTFFICDCSGESFGSLSQEQLDRYIEKYKNPERFARVNGEIIAVPYKTDMGRTR